MLAILLKSLSAGFTSFEDLETIVESCANQHSVDNIIAKKDITHYNFTDNFLVILKCIRDNKQYIDRTSRNKYCLTEEGRQYSDSIDLPDQYKMIINNTKPWLDIMVEAFEISKAKADLHPIKVKYFNDDQLIPEISNLFKGAYLLYTILNDKLHLIAFHFKTKLPENSILYQDDIVLSLNEGPLIMHDL